MSAAGYVTSGVFRGYDTGRHHFVDRLRKTRALFARALEASPPGPLVVYDICSSDGRVVLPVLAQHPRRDHTRAFLIELDPEGARAARAAAAHMHLGNVEVMESDAGLPSTYRALPRADVVILSGVFFHLQPEDQARLMAFLRQVCAAGARLVWTSGSRRGLHRRLRLLVAANGFVVEAIARVPYFAAGGPTKHEVGLARFVGHTEPLTADARLFTFSLTFWRRHPALHAAARPLIHLARRLAASARKNSRHPEVSAAAGGAPPRSTESLPRNQA